MLQRASITFHKCGDVKYMSRDNFEGDHSLSWEYKLLVYLLCCHCFLPNHRNLLKLLKDTF